LASDRISENFPWLAALGSQPFVSRKVRQEQSPQRKLKKDSFALFALCDLCVNPGVGFYCKFFKSPNARSITSRCSFLWIPGEPVAGLADAARLEQNSSRRPRFFGPSENRTNRHAPMFSGSS
jgi:hypothetical protein